MILRWKTLKLNELCLYVDFPVINNKLKRYFWGHLGLFCKSPSCFITKTSTLRDNLINNTDGCEWILYVFSRQTQLILRSDFMQQPSALRNVFLSNYHNNTNIQMKLQRNGERERRDDQQEEFRKRPSVLQLQPQPIGLQTGLLLLKCRNYWTWGLEWFSSLLRLCSPAAPPAGWELTQTVLPALCLCTLFKLYIFTAQRLKGSTVSKCSVLQHRHPTLTFTNIFSYIRT